MFTTDPNFDHQFSTGNIHRVSVTDGVTTYPDILQTDYANIDKPKNFSQLSATRSGALQPFWTLDWAEFLFFDGLRGSGHVPGLDIEVSLTVTRSEFLFLPENLASPATALTPPAEEGGSRVGWLDAVSTVNWIVKGDLTLGPFGNRQIIPFAFDGLYVCEDGNCMDGNAPVVPNLAFNAEAADRLVVGGLAAKDESADAQARSDPFVLDIATVDGLTYQLRSLLRVAGVRHIPVPEPGAAASAAAVLIGLLAVRQKGVG